MSALSREPGRSSPAGHAAGEAVNPPVLAPTQPDLFTVPRPVHGRTFEPQHDQVRLNAQQARVFAVLQDGEWRTLREISDLTGDPEASVSARLRDFRKESCGGHVIERRRRGDPKRGLHEYRLKRKEGV